jgi:hypothetical protein
MRRLGVLLLTVALAGCGSHRTTTTSTTPVAGSASCEASGGTGKPTTQSCTYILSDGERFSCGQVIRGSAPTAARLERAGCRRLASLALSGSERTLIARVDRARSCLASDGLRVAGGPVLPPASPGSTQPDGEIVISDARPTFIAFYTDAARARRLAPAIVRSAARTHVLVERRGAVTIAWSHAPAGDVRASVLACLPG